MGKCLLCILIHIMLFVVLLPLSGNQHNKTIILSIAFIAHILDLDRTLRENLQNKLELNDIASEQNRSTN